MCGSFPGLLIGRTAVHSGKDPAFVAYDQFLSTGILQLLSRGEVRGSFASILPCPLSCPLSPLPDSCSAADRSYSITSSARASSVGGTSRPSAFAVLSLRYRLNLFACCTGGLRLFAFATNRLGVLRLERLLHGALLARSRLEV